MNEPVTDRNGFTLIELLIVVSILGLLLAATVPAMSRFLRTARLAGAANTLMADLHQTRSLATMERKTYQIVFDSNAYRIFPVTSPSSARTRALPRGFACSASDTATFYAWGLTAPVAVTIAGSGASETVQVSANGSVSHD